MTLGGGGKPRDTNGKRTQNGEDAKKEDGRRNSGQREEFVKPPDGGWGWMVVLSSFLIHVIADGIVYSFGIFYIEFLDYFKAGKGETAWVGSLVPGVTLCVGKYRGRCRRNISGIILDLF